MFLMSKRRSPRIMIVDSNILSILVAEKLLVRSGFEVHKMSSTNGILPRINYVKPDLLLIDYQIPRLGGDVFLESIKKLPRFSRMIIVLYTDQEANVLRELCVKHDFHGYFTKSMDINDLPEFLGRFFKKPEGAAT